ncbi:hypothetical protein CAMSH0001_0656 [Campylobacter showae RM3277]|uniref:Uncharacterized protein n=1 Tax=Campylobacter showae RM3277 TaxID=553219 RepID=C6RGK3_9BACT|nr:hypothetical protein CAMSH0001_0656 [Campylobacter showae RM3277]
MAWIILFREIILAFRFCLNFTFRRFCLRVYLPYFCLRFLYFFIAHYRICVFYLAFRDVKFSLVKPF